MTDHIKKNKNMKKKVFIWILLSLVLISSIHAQAYDPSALLQALNNQLGGIKDWYAVESVTTDANGKEVAVLNTQYQGARTVIDFMLMLLLLGYVFRKNEQVKSMLGKGGPAILAFVLSFSYVFVANRGFLSELGPLVFYIPLLVGTWVIYTLILLLLGKKDMGVGGKILVLLVSIIIVILIYIALSKTGMLSFMKTGTTATSSEELRTRVIAGESPGPPGKQLTPLEQATALYNQANQKYNDAEHEFGLGNYETAKQLNTEARNLFTQADALTLTIQ